MVDFRCYFVTGAVAGDSASGAAHPAGSHHALVERCVAAARGGAGVIQVRSKPISALNLYHLASDIADAIQAYGLPTKVLVDDRVDVALALMRAGKHVHGVHVGQDDLPVRAVRDVLGPDAIIGLTTGTLELIEQANQVADVIDYVGCGPFRDTPTKQSGRTPLGLEGYGPIVEASKVPVVAIGDVTIDDAPALAATGMDGLAVVRGLMGAEDPEGYARGIIEGFNRGAAASLAAPLRTHRGGANCG